MSIRRRLSRDMLFNNPHYRPWKNRPVGLNTFAKFTRVEVLDPTPGEERRLRAITKAHNFQAYVVRLEGRRVFMTRDALLNKEEYFEARDNEAQASTDVK